MRVRPFLLTTVATLLVGAALMALVRIGIWISDKSPEDHEGLSHVIARN